MVSRSAGTHLVTNDEYLSPEPMSPSSNNITSPKLKMLGGVWKNRKPESGIGTGMETGTGTGTGNSNGTETAM